MSTLLTRRRGRTLAGVAATAVAAASLALLPAAPSQAATTGTVTSGTATWGISTYFSAGSFGRPNAYTAAYVAPAAWDATSKVNTWGNATGTVNQDGSAALDVAGTTVNFTTTSGTYLKLADLHASLDPTGNGVVSAVVTYGDATGTPGAITYNDTAPSRGPQRVDVVTLAGNTAADLTRTATTASWTDLDGSWSQAFLDYLAGDATATPAVKAFTFKNQVSSNASQTPLPFAFSVSTVAPTATATVTAANPTTGLTVKFDGTGFRGVSQTGDAGVYVGIAPSGGLPDVTTQAGMNAFAAAAYLTPGQLATGTISTSLTAPKDKLSKGTSYSVYTWQAHTHSNTSQDTVTPLTVDWDAIFPATTTPVTPPVTTPITTPVTTPVTPAATTVDAKLTKAPTAAKRGKLVADLGAGATGAVTVVLTKGTKTKTVKATLVGGKVTVKLPKLTPGKWKVSVSYAGDATHAASTATSKVKVKAPKKRK